MQQKFGYNTKYIPRFNRNNFEFKKKIITSFDKTLVDMKLNNLSDEIVWTQKTTWITTSFNICEKIAHFFCPMPTNLADTGPSWQGADMTEQALKMSSHV